jgi:hypothetical protein
VKDLLKHSRTFFFAYFSYAGCSRAFTTLVALEICLRSVGCQAFSSFLRDRLCPGHIMHFENGGVDFPWFISFLLLYNFTLA